MPRILRPLGQARCMNSMEPNMSGQGAIAQSHCAGSTARDALTRSYCLFRSHCPGIAPDKYGRVGSIHA